MKKTRTMMRNLLGGMLMIAVMGLFTPAEAGVALGATRVIYPAGQKQVQLAVTNNDDSSTYLNQSWVENAEGVKDGRFVVTPPLFAMQANPGSAITPYNWPLSAVSSCITVQPVSRCRQIRPQKNSLSAAAQARSH